MNRVEKFKLNAAKAYEFARGVLVEKNDKLVYIYARATHALTGGTRYLNLDLAHKPIKRKKLNPTEQKVFIGSPTYAYKYAWKFKERLTKEVEHDFLNTITETNLPLVLNYCKMFGLTVPESFHNFAIITAAMPSKDEESLKRMRKSKRYLSNIDKNKKAAKEIINLFIANGWVKEEESVKDLLEKLNK